MKHIEQLPLYGVHLYQVKVCFIIVDLLLLITLVFFLNKINNVYSKAGTWVIAAMENAF